MEEHGFVPLDTMKVDVAGEGDYRSATYSIYGMYVDEEERRRTTLGATGGESW
jgi:hypothetical protein